MSLYVVGALHLDVIVRAPRLPFLDETLQGHAVRYVFGGKGGNQAVAAARAGASVAMAGAVGSDGFADTLLAALDGEGIDRSRVVRQPGASGMSVAIEEAGGGYAAVIVSAANLAVTGEGAPPEGTTHLLLQSEIPQAANIAAARAARVAGARVLLNAAPARPLPDRLLGLIDILVVNSVEAAMLAGVSEGSPDKAARILRRLGPQTVIVTLGADGLVCHQEDDAFALAVPTVAVASTHGAGDVFLGTLAARLDAGDDLPTALDVAQAAAARHVATPPGHRPAAIPAQGCLP